MKYARTLEEECGDSMTSYYNIQKFLHKWWNLGLLELRPPYKGSNIELLELTQKGKEFIRRLGGYFEGSST